MIPVAVELCRLIELDSALRRTDVSYFGNRTLRHVTADLIDIAVEERMTDLAVWAYWSCESMPVLWSADIDRTQGTVVAALAAAVIKPSVVLSLSKDPSLPAYRLQDANPCANWLFQLLLQRRWRDRSGAVCNEGSFDKLRTTRGSQILGVGYRSVRSARVLHCRQPA